MFQWVSWDVSLLRNKNLYLPICWFWGRNTVDVTNGSCAWTWAIRDFYENYKNQLIRNGTLNHSIIWECLPYALIRCHRPAKKTTTTGQKSFRFPFPQWQQQQQQHQQVVHIKPFTYKHTKYTIDSLHILQ